MPSRAACVPGNLSEFLVVTQSLNPIDGTHVRLTLASAQRAGSGKPAVIYDLNLWREGGPMGDLGSRGWRAIVDALHVQQREIFESSITDKARELFQ